MKMSFAFALTFLMMGCAAQQQPIFCYDIPNAEELGEVDSSMMGSMVEQAKELMEIKFEDETIEDGVGMLPEAINSTFVTLFQQALDDYGNVTIGLVVEATIQGLLDTKNGKDMMTTFLQDEREYAQIILTLIGNFNGSCNIDNQDVVLNTAESMLSPIFSLIPIEQVQNITAQIGVITLERYNSGEDWLKILAPLAEFELGGLSGLLSPAAGDLVSTFLGGFIDQFLTNPNGALEAVTSFINNVQEAYEVDTAEIVQRAQDVVVYIISQLS
eukprot:TRINITY_DN9285_c0_g1_i11.p1 TRINITY_DN9285_c0_g1~~TRINITY_DN9285_c0_g1_i11.p1  ORF type:complete len:272 (-),score=51.50 TRINITY_DN9285_c0_g1_i11:158-973(-)